MNKSEIVGFLLGTLLGDATIYRGQSFSCEQTSLPLIELKQYYLSNLPLVKHPRAKQNVEIYTRTREDIRYKTLKTVYAVHKTHPWIKDLYSLCYLNGRKTLNASWLKKLTHSGVAAWIMDDGYMDYKPQNSTRNLRICTDHFSEFEVKLCCQFFSERYNIGSKIYWRKWKNSIVPRLSFNASSTQKLASVIYPYMLPEFYYKIDLHYLEETINSCRVIQEYKDIYPNIISQRKTTTNIVEDIV